MAPSSRPIATPIFAAFVRIVSTKDVGLAGFLFNDIADHAKRAAQMMLRSVRNSGK
jgi:hypothetical protein